MPKRPPLLGTRGGRGGDGSVAMDDTFAEGMEGKAAAHERGTADEDERNGQGKPGEKGETRGSGFFHLAYVQTENAKELIGPGVGGDVGQGDAQIDDEQDDDGAHEGKSQVVRAHHGPERENLAEGHEDGSQHGGIKAGRGSHGM